ncbi:hypothetical protein [Mesorhizobium sp. M0491]|uniref:hypothetical protein n=1 Tax=Mesorhizobium sp. M0491 TaxID=2956950 RepID=UPI00333B1AC2
MVTFSYGVVLTPGQWSLLFNQKQNVLGYTPVNRAGDTMLGPLVTTPSNVNGAGFSILPGVAPENPVDGMYWATIDGLFYQIGGATVGPFGTGDVAGPPTSVVNRIAVFSTTDGAELADSGISLGSQAANLLLATPGAGAGAPRFRLMVGADLPTPQTVALGGVFSSTAPTHNFATGINASGYLTFAQPALGDISGLAANMAAFLAAGTSAQLAATMADETGSGPLVFATNPTIAHAAASTAVTQTPGDNSTHLATTAYVQAAIYATTTLPACRLATTTALASVTYANGASGVGATLTASANGALTVDGVAANVNDVILVKNQASTFQNGIYTVTATGSAGAPFVLTRATYYNLAAEIDLGDQTFVTGGATLGATTFVQNGTENPVIGTNPITFAQTAGVGAYTAGNGLTLVGTQFAIDPTITVDKTTAQTLSNKTLASPAMTGIPSAPTPAQGNNSTQIATTAFVDLAAAGTLINVQAITSSGTYSPTAGATRGIVFVTGGGAGGTTGTGSGSESGGGAGGTTLFYMAPLSAQSVTIGAGGGAGAAGGSSAFGTITANGGSAAASQNIGGRGGAASGTGNLNLAGGDGACGTNATGNSQAGGGGSSYWGGGGSGGQTVNGHSAGASAQAYGAGGGGGAYSAGVGGNGANGVVVVFEFK